jgi:hypothetical protein
LMSQRIWVTTTHHSGFWPPMNMSIDGTWTYSQTEILHWRNGVASFSLMIWITETTYLGGTLFPPVGRFWWWSGYHLVEEEEEERQLSSVSTRWQWSLWERAKMSRRDAVGMN